jgi:hypothetical protein
MSTMHEDLLAHLEVLKSEISMIERILGNTKLYQLNELARRSEGFDRHECLVLFGPRSGKPSMPSLGCKALLAMCARQFGGKPVVQKTTRGELKRYRIV